MKRTTTRFMRTWTFLICVVLAASTWAGVLKDRTLVSWAAPATLDQRGGSALTISQGDRFDGLVFAELAKDTWMLGSDYFRRTCKDQKAWPKERTVDAFVQVAATYRDADRTVTLYRDGVAFASYAVPQGVETAFAGNDLQAIIGIRHPGRTDTFIGKVKDARVYARALTAEQLAALKPGVMGETRPFAWWNFATAGACELTGRFAPGTLVGRAAIKGGALVLQEKGDTFIARPRAATAEAWDGKSPVPASVMAVSRRLRERIMQDPHRPFYHFACIDGIASPGDSNGAFYSNGRYHLMYLYRKAGIAGKDRKFAWGHMESVDLLHWRHLPDSIVPEQGDGGAFSGGGFVDDDGTAYLSYWMLWDTLRAGSASCAASTRATRSGRAIPPTPSYPQQGGAKGARGSLTEPRRSSRTPTPPTSGRRTAATTCSPATSRFSTAMAESPTRRRSSRATGSTSTFPTTWRSGSS